MRSFIQRNSCFFIPYFVFLFISTILLTIFTKAQIHIVINSLHTPFFDSLFKMITFFGDGMMYLFVLVFLLTRKYKWAIAFLVAVIISTIILHLCKQVFFFHMYRPSKYFELFETYKLYLVEGVKLHSISSFPSGHTTTAFTVFFTMAIFIKKHWVKSLMFAFAFLTGYSRMYLSQHFLMDVVAGSLLGTGSVMLAFYYAKYLNKQWMQKALFRRCKPTDYEPVLTKTPGIATS